MAAIYSNGGNRWNILGYALSSLYKISMFESRCGVNFVSSYCCHLFN